MAWQTERGYLRFRRNFYIKVGMPKAKWQEEIETNEQEYLKKHMVLRYPNEDKVNKIF